MHRHLLPAAIAAACIACGPTASEPAPEPPPVQGDPETPHAEPRPAQPQAAPEARPAPSVDPDNYPRGLLVATSQFEVEGGRATANPGPARLELITRRQGQWRTEVLEDPQSNVFHKAMVFQPTQGSPAILTLGGTAAALKLWRRSGGQWQSETLWTEEFGGRFNRMRDAEIADLYGDGPAIAVATHDQGVFATVRLANGTPQIDRLDRQPNTFIHEVEIGDLDGNGVLEVYTTPSEPNDLGGGVQHGQVVRYIPREGAGSRTVVAELGDRHAKEIWVGDADGDGRDELYVAVEALTRGTGDAMEIVEPVEIRRYDHDTAPTARVVVASIRDRLTRFLTVGDVDGDGRREMVIAAFRSGLWLARPGRDPRSEWSVESIDRDSSGFEHAALLTDLDGDGRDELYVGADDQGELRRYVFVDGRPRRERILERPVRGAIMTWNLMPFDAAMLD